MNTLSNPESVFIFQIGNDFSTSAVSSVVTLLNVLDCNVYFVVAGTTTMNTGTVFLGNVIGQGNMNLDALVTVAGRVISTGGSITLDDNVVTNATCATCVEGLDASQIPAAEATMRWLMSLIWGVPKHPRHAIKGVRGLGGLASRILRGLRRLRAPRLAAAHAPLRVIASALSPHPHIGCGALDPPLESPSFVEVRP